MPETRAQIQKRLAAEAAAAAELAVAPEASAPRQPQQEAPRVSAPWDATQFVQAKVPEVFQKFKAPAKVGAKVTPGKERDEE